MKRGISAFLAGLSVAVLTPLPHTVFAAIDDTKVCAAETARQEKQAAIPDHLLHAISLVESGRPIGEHGALAAWPWTVTGEGQGHFLPDKRSAIALVRQLQARGISNIDVGCMQVNLQAHPTAFANLETAFDPAANVAYAAAFLVHLHGSSGNWPTAAAYYHSQTPLLAAAYESKVVAQWNASRRRDGNLLLVADRVANGPPVPIWPETAVGAPLSAAAWFDIGRNALKAQNFAVAEPALIHAVALDSRNARYLDALGAAAAGRGNTERALAAYSMAIVMDKDDGFAWYNTAVIHYNAGRVEAAIEAFRRAGIAYVAKGDMESVANILTDLKALTEGEKS